MANKYDPRTTTKWGAPKRNTWSDSFGVGTKGNEELQDQAKAIAGATADLLPVVGDARSLGRAYDAAKAGDWGDAAFEAGTTAAGWIPVAGPLARGALRGAKNADLAATAVRTLDPEYAKLFGREVIGSSGPLAKSAGASALYGKNADEVADLLKASNVPSESADTISRAVKNADKTIERMKKGKARKDLQMKEFLGSDWENIVRDMELERQLPSIGGVGPGKHAFNPAEYAKYGEVKTSRGPNPRAVYRPYETPEGDIVHGSFFGFGPNEEPSLTSIMGGTKLDWPDWHGATRAGADRQGVKANRAVLGADVADNRVGKRLKKQGITSARDLKRNKGGLIGPLGGCK